MLEQVQEQIPLAAAEVYVFTFRGHLCFLPGLPWIPMGRWHLPKVICHYIVITTARRLYTRSHETVCACRQKWSSWPQRCGRWRGCCGHCTSPSWMASMRFAVRSAQTLHLPCRRAQTEPCCAGAEHDQPARAALPQGAHAAAGSALARRAGCCCGCLPHAAPRRCFQPAALCQRGGGAGLATRPELCFTLGGRRQKAKALCVQALMRISDFQRRRILQLIKHYRMVRKARSLVRAQSLATSLPTSRHAHRRTFPHCQ